MENQHPGRCVDQLYSGQRVPRTVSREGEVYDWHRIGSVVAPVGLGLIIVTWAVLLFTGTLLQVLHGIGTLFGWLPG